MEGDRRHSLRLVFNFNVFLGFDGLVETVRVTTTVHDTTRKWIDNLNLAFVNYVVDVVQHNVVSTQSLVNVVNQDRVVDIVEVFQTEDTFSLVNPLVSQGDGLRSQVNGVVFFSLQAFSKVVCPGVEGG